MFNWQTQVQIFSVFALFGYLSKSSPLYQAGNHNQSMITFKRKKKEKERWKRGIKILEGGRYQVGEIEGRATFDREVEKREKKASWFHRKVKDYCSQAFGFTDSQPALIGLMIVLQYITAPYSAVVGFLMSVLRWESSMKHNYSPSLLNFFFPSYNLTTT